MERLIDENAAALPPSLHPLCRPNRPKEPVTNPFTNLQSDSRHSNAVCISEHAQTTWVMSQEARIALPIQPPHEKHLNRSLYRVLPPFIRPTFNLRQVPRCDITTQLHADHAPHHHYPPIKAIVYQEPLPSPPQTPLLHFHPPH